MPLEYLQEQINNQVTATNIDHKREKSGKKDVTNKIPSVIAEEIDDQTPGQLQNNNTL